MSIFIKRDDLLPVSLDEDPTNVIWIRRKMDLGTKNRVQDALMSIQNVDNTGAFSGVGINLGRQNTVLLQANVVKWEGEKFRDDPPPTGTGMPMPCTPQNIEAMDPDDPLVDVVLAKINEQNTKKPLVDGKGQELSPLLPTTTSSENGATASKASQTR